MKKVRIIPVLPKENKKLRIAAYCRVSTFGLAQMRSLENNGKRLAGWGNLLPQPLFL
ncbi:MAG: hypothetical protein ACOY46_09525 [Bacillota bacterium]